MAIIDPDGLFSGDRLAACSDQAKLFWPWLFLASNGHARLELSYPSIISKVFKNFSKVPESSDLWTVFREYEANFLAVLYIDEERWWCQFITSEKFLPRYRSKRDDASPAPPVAMMEKHAKGYMAWKKANSFGSNDFGKFRKVSVGEERSGVGVGVGIGSVETRARETASETEVPNLVKQIVCAHPKSVQRSTRPNEVRQAHEVAVISAMTDEIEQSGAAAEDVLEMMLARTRLIAEEVPKNHWKYIADVPEFYRNHDYRREPETWSSGGSNGKTGNDRGPAVGRVSRSQEAARRAGEESIAATSGSEEEDSGFVDADDGGVSPPGNITGDGEDVPDGVRGPGGEVLSPANRNGAPGIRHPPEVVSPPRGSRRGA
jgi:hypothetical protein